MSMNLSATYDSREICLSQTPTKVTVALMTKAPETEARWEWRGREAHRVLSDYLVWFASCLNQRDPTDRAILNEHREYINSFLGSDTRKLKVFIT